MAQLQRSTAQRMFANLDSESPRKFLLFESQSYVDAKAECSPVVLCQVLQYIVFAVIDLCLTRLKFTRGSFEIKHTGIVLLEAERR